MNEVIFALDIGTQSVTGIILKLEQNTYTVLDYCIKEHHERAMLDGQIHHVVSVAEVIQEVKNELEKKHGSLEGVYVAAAGRSLKTVQSEASIQLNQQPITSYETVKHLELSAVQTAQHKIANEEKVSGFMDYYCVGYSVLHYKLDGEEIGSFIDQSGNVATVEVIATFLPKIVVESLLSALDRAGLKMEALTLEPIAAIRVLIPQSMRRLNVALVDIGAGTSDIAITDKGTVVAYGMVPVAGDEITEAISDHYLLDFPIAEQTKRKIVNDGKATVSDILGTEITITYEQLVEDLHTHIEQIANQLADKIFKLNKKSPKAVMLVGGGSLTPEITTILATKLQLPTNRVAIRGIDAIQQLKTSDILPAGPVFVTPIGIAIAAKQNPVHYISVKVNGRSIRLFEMKRLTVGDCLIQAGIDLKKLYGKPGLAKIIELNGKKITLPGEYGGAPNIYVNGMQESADCSIKNGDEIEVKKGVDGKSPQSSIKQLLGEVPTITVHFNEKQYRLPTIYKANGIQVNETYLIQDNDTITFTNLKTFKAFFTEVIKDDLESFQAFNIFVNNEKVYIPKGQASLLLNGEKVDWSTALKNNDHLSVIPNKEITVLDVFNQLNKPYWDTISIQFNGKPVQLKQKKYIVTRDGVQLKNDSTVYNNDHLIVTEHTRKPFIFQDVFRYINLDISNIRGSYEIYQNNKPCTFYDRIDHGDQLSIKWE